MSLSDLLVVFVLALTVYMLWRHHAVRGRAYEAALRHTKFHGVLLLDESIVLKRVRIVRSHKAVFSLKRHFQFEFSSLGDERYKGEVIFIGHKQVYIQLQAFKTDFKGVPVE